MAAACKMDGLTVPHAAATVRVATEVVAAAAATVAEVVTVVAAATTVVVGAAVMEEAVVATPTEVEATAVVPQAMVALAVVIRMVAAQEVPLTATRKILSSSVDWENASSMTSSKYSCKVTCSQFAFEC